MLKGKKFDAFALYHGTEIFIVIREQIHRELKTFLYYGYL